MKRKVIIITQGLSRIVQPLVQAENIEIAGLIECAPRIEIKHSVFFDLYFRSRENETNSLRCYADKRNIPYYYMRDNSMGLRIWIQNIAPDLIVVYSMSQLLKKEIYSLPKYGTINLHHALLPKYRGPNSCFWSYYNMDSIGGVTVHYIDEYEDTGDILMQKECVIPLGMKSPERFDLEISGIGVKLLLNTISNINTILPNKQPIYSTTPRARNLKLEEHKSVIDWDNWDIKRIWHILRGTEGWLNAISMPTGIYTGTRWRIREYDHVLVNGKLGDIYKVDKKYFICCKDGRIEISSHFCLKELVRYYLGRFL